VGDMCARMHLHTQKANQSSGMEPGNEAREVSNILVLSSLKHSLLLKLANCCKRFN